jgi:hypothetical protein
MTSLYTSLLVFISVFGAGMLALLLQVMLPKHHLSAATQDTVKLAMGLVATMAALVLGLLVASAKGSYDTQKSEVTLMAAKIAFTGRILEVYGPEAAAARRAFREAVEQITDRLWPQTTSQSPQTNPRAVASDVFYHELKKLLPQNDEQRECKAKALDVSYEIAQVRWLLFAQTSSSISMPLLIVVVCWLAVLFFSFGLFAPANSTVVVALLVAALSVAAAIFLVLEMDQPFGGMIQISPEPMITALKQIGS